VACQAKSLGNLSFQDGYTENKRFSVAQVSALIGATAITGTGTETRRESGEDKREFELRLKKDWREFERRRKR